MKDVTFSVHDLADAYFAGLKVGSEIVLNHAENDLTPEIKEKITFETATTFIDTLKIILEKKNLKLEPKSGIN